MNFLLGKRVLKEIDSPINGKLTVIQDLAWGVYIKGGGLTQSGGVAYKVWQTSLSKIRNSIHQPVGEKLNSLILGLGGGSIAKLIRSFWPKSEISGVDLDPVIVELGKRYLDLGSYGAQVKIGDAFEYVIKKSKLKAQKFDLVCVDTYIGDDFPEKFESQDFLLAIKKLLGDTGVAVFNRLYYGEKRPRAMDFLKKLKEVFENVDIVFPQANIMFICRN